MIKKGKLKTPLQDHQKRVLKKLENNSGIIVYHGLGSGKTLTSIAATDNEPTDVVVPASLISNYKKEVEKHTTGHKPDVISFDKFIKEPRPPKKNLVIDEAHMAGRSESLRSKELMSKAPLNYKKRILLTGTPIRNHPSELAPLLRMVTGDKEVPIDRSAFSEKFIAEHTARPGFLSRKLLKRTPSTTYSIKNRKKFIEIVKNIVDHHSAGKGDYPTVVNESVKVPLSKEQKDIYKFLMGKVGPAMKYKIKKNLPPSKSEAKSLNSFLSGLRQISNTARPFGGTSESKIDKAVAENIKMMKKDKNHKALVYSNFLGAGVLPYSEKLKKKNIPHFVFHGQTKEKDRKQAVEDFNKKKLKTLLISGAGSQGLDLKGVKLVQLLEPHWNKSRLDQATGRAVRYKSHAHLPKSERNVLVQDYHSTIPKSFWQSFFGKKQDTSADEYLSGLAKKKEELNDMFLDILKEQGK